MPLADFFATMVKDVRYGFRQLRRTPGFALVAVLTLALGIGANTAVFSVMNAVLLRYLPVANPQQLVVLHYTNQPDNSGQTGYDDTSLPEQGFEALRRQNDVFSNLVAFVPLGIPKVPVRLGSEPEEAAADEVSGNFFSGLGVRMARGRGFTIDDEQNHAQVAVLSYSYWTSRFGGNPSALEQTVYVKGVPFSVVGIAAPEFTGLERDKATDMWVPLQTNPQLKPWGASALGKESLYNSPDWFFLMTIGRLKPGVSMGRAEAQVIPAFQQAVYASLGQPKPDEKRTGLRLTPARGIEGLNDDYKQPLAVLMSMVGLVLLIACANVAMLLAARNAGRQREFSVRLALGASRTTMFRQLLTESVLLVAAGGILGWGFSLLATRALAVWSAMEITMAPDWRVLLFALGISALAALVFGLAPLRSAMRVPVGVALKTAASASRQDRKKIRSGHAVVALQISLCLMLLVGAGLLVRTMMNLQNANLGLRASGLLVFGVQSPPGIHDNAGSVHFYHTLLDRMRALPGVESGTLMQNRIGAGWSNNTSAFVDGAVPGGKKFADMRWNAVGPDFFHVLEVPMLLGRDFNDADTATSPKVAIVNQTFAGKYVKGSNAIGHRIARLETDPKDQPQYTVVGVVTDNKYTSVRENPRPMAYFPFTQIRSSNTMHIELRTGNPAALLPEIRRVVKEFGPDLPVLQPMLQEEQFQMSFIQDRLFARLSVFFGLLAALLVATGLYGTMAYRVSRRTAEIGVRMALGAQRRQVLWMVLRESLLVCAVGVAVGMPLAIASSRLLRTMLFNLSPFDPLSFVLALLGVGLVTLAATALPARRASSVDPIVALRYE